MSPERVDPGREDWTTKTTPKVVGGITPASTARGRRRLSRGARHGARGLDARGGRADEAAREHLSARSTSRSSTSSRSCATGWSIDVWEVVDAAATKPFGFASFKPGPGLGGHCIPIDPFYLTWKAREFDFSTRFIELAGEVNNNMPYFCRSLISQALNHGANKSVNGSKILILGVAYKPDIGDCARVAGGEADPPAAERRRRRRLPRPVRAGVRRDDARSRSSPRRYDCVAIVTNHSDDRLRRRSCARGKVIVDFRNATKGHEVDGKVWKL